MLSKRQTPRYWGGLVLLFMGGVCLNMGTASTGESGDWYVQSLKGSLRMQPRVDGKIKLVLNRGEKVRLEEKKGDWFRVRQGKQSGWISRFFLSKYQPMGIVEIDEGIFLNQEKANRRKSSSYMVSATSRGLTNSARVRGGREKFLTDYAALDKLEQYQLSEEKVRKFGSTANLIVK